MKGKTIGLLIGGLAAASAVGGAVYAATRKKKSILTPIAAEVGRINMPTRVVLDRYEFANYTYGQQENPHHFRDIREVTNWEFTSDWKLSGIGKSGKHPQGRDSSLPAGTYPNFPDVAFSFRNSPIPGRIDEYAGGVNFYIEVKDFWPVVVKFRPRWYMARLYDRVFMPVGAQVGYTGQNKRWRMAGLGVVTPDGQIKSRNNASSDYDDNSFGNGTYADRDVIFYQGIARVADYTGLSTSGGIAHPYFHLPNYFLDSIYASQYFKQIGEYQSKNTSMEMNYDSGYPYWANMIFIHQMLLMGFPKMNLFDWCVISNGQGVDSEHNPVLDHDSLHSYFIAMCAKQRTLSVADIFKWIFDVAQFIYNICSGSIMSSYSSSQEALASSAKIQESANGSAFMQGLRKVEIVLNNNRLPTLEKYFWSVPADQLTIMDLVPSECEPETGNPCIRINQSQPVDLKTLAGKTLRRRT